MKRMTPFLIFILLLIGMNVFPYIPISIFNIDMSNLSQSIKIVYNLCCDIGFIIIIFMLYRKETIHEWKDYFRNFREYFELSFKYYFIGLVFMFISNYMITLFFSGANANNEDMVRNLIDLYPVYMIFSVGIYAPFVEENIFRRSIKDAILSIKDNKNTKYVYIISSGLIFSLMHILGMVNSNLDYLYIIPYLSLGIAFAALYYKTDNLFSTIFMHSLHNLVAVILYLMVGV